MSGKLSSENKASHESKLSPTTIHAPIEAHASTVSAMTEVFLRAERLIFSALGQCIDEEVCARHPQLLSALTATLLYGFIEGEGISESRISLPNILSNLKSVISSGKLSHEEASGVLSQLSDFGLITEKGEKFRLSRTADAEQPREISVIIATLCHVDQRLRNFSRYQRAVSAELRASADHRTSRVEDYLSASESNAHSDLPESEGKIPPTSPDSNSSITVTLSAPEGGVCEEVSRATLQGIEYVDGTTTVHQGDSTVGPVGSRDWKFSLPAPVDSIVQEQTVEYYIRGIGDLSARLAQLCDRMKNKYEETLQAVDDVQLAKDVKLSATTKQMKGLGKKTFSAMVERIHASETEKLKGFTKREIEAYVGGGQLPSSLARSITPKEFKKNFALCRQASINWMKTAISRTIDYSMELFVVSTYFSQLGPTLRLVDACGVNGTSDLVSHYDRVLQEVPFLQPSWWPHSIANRGRDHLQRKIIEEFQEKHLIILFKFLSHVSNWQYALDVKSVEKSVGDQKALKELYTYHLKLNAFLNNYGDAFLESFADTVTQILMLTEGGLAEDGVIRRATLDPKKRGRLETYLDTLVRDIPILITLLELIRREFPGLQVTPALALLEYRANVLGRDLRISDKRGNFEAKLEQVLDPGLSPFSKLGFFFTTIREVRGYLNVPSFAFQVMTNRMIETPVVPITEWLTGLQGELEGM